MIDNPKWDSFISHAAEDKDAFVRPLAVALQSLRGLDLNQQPSG